MVAQRLCCWPEYEYVRQLYANGKYGKLLSSTMPCREHIPAWSWDDWMADDKRSGLTPFDLHIHDLDIMVNACGALKQAVRSRARQADQDHLMAMYGFDGFTIRSEATWHAPQCYNFNAGFRFSFKKAVVVNSREGLIVYEKDGENAGLELLAAF